VKLELNAAVLAEDLPDIYAFIARNNPAAAQRVLEAVHRTFDLIAREPACGVLYASRNPQSAGVRMLPIDAYPNYLVFYRIGGEAVRVLYVVHGARHLPRLFRRDPRQ
jgi:toxin ParE1/3/4